MPENMEMRDFWIFHALAQGRKLFLRDGNGPANLLPNHWRQPEQIDGESWRRWVLGRTGLPLLDAAMREMLGTGYTSNRCRQIPVSVLSKDMRLDWRLGAEVFQWLLVDHDVGCNWGNWRYFAGVGTDPKQRHYKAISQGLRYDPEAFLVKAWCPELRPLDARMAQLIPLATLARRKELAWPDPLVDPMNQLAWEDQKGLP